MLYVLKEKNNAAFRDWMQAIDETGKSTKVCKDKEWKQCIVTPWPRLCEADFPCGEKQPTEILGLTSGACILIPEKDVADYERMARHTNTTLGPLMSKAIITDISIPHPELRDVVRAYTIKEHFPLHLEAVRVLILMMMNNPDLSFETLPPTPSPDGLIGAISPSSLAGDPVVVNSRARAISSRQRWNPFYRLLADGATKETRNVITDYCPTLDQKPDRNRPGWLWRWETDEEKERAISYSGGWDCVFVGLLYNKMRVEKPLADQLLARFEAILRALTNGLGSAPDQLKKAKAALVEANKRAADAQKTLDDARDQYAKAEQQAIDQLDAERRRLESLIGDLPSKIGGLARQLRSLPNCPRLVPCGPILDPVRRLNRPIEEAIDRVNRDLAAANNQHNDAVRKIEEARARIKAWTDQKLGEAERQALQEQQRLVKLTDDLETFMKLAPQAKTQTVSFLKTWKQDRNH